MKRFFFTAALSVAAMAGFAEKGKPYNHLNYLDDPEEFSFAVLADMYGADEKGEVYRDGFNRAVKAINTLRPEFVMSVGDLIPFAWHHNEANIRHQHKVLEERINRFKPPFFCTVGNHDIASSVAVPGFSNAYERSSSMWREYRGNPYYSFVRKNVLFVVLNCQDDCRVGVRYCGLSKEQYTWFQKRSEIDHVCNAVRNNIIISFCDVFENGRFPLCRLSVVDELIKRYIEQLRDHYKNRNVGETFAALVF